MSVKKILLIDVSHLFFRAFFAIPKNLTDADNQPINAVYGVCSMILSILEAERPDYLFGAKDEKEKTKRHEIMPDYKGHRPEMPPELVAQLPRISDIFELFHIPAFSENGYEADDVLASIAERYRGNADFVVEIVTGDHDAFQLVGENVCVLVPQNGGKPALRLDREGVFSKTGVYPEQIADYKGMAGDNSDNLKGIAGVGPKTAVKLLDEYTHLESILENAESIPGKLGERLQASREIALLTKQLATLHRNLKLENFDLAYGSIDHLSDQELEAYFRKYHFHSLINRLPKVFAKSASAVEKSTEEEELWDELESAQETKLSDAFMKQEEQDQMSLF